MTSTQIQTEVRALRLRLRPSQLEETEPRQADPAKSEANEPEIDKSEGGRPERRASADQRAHHRPEPLILRAPLGSWAELGLGLYIVLQSAWASRGIRGYFNQPTSLDCGCLCAPRLGDSCPPGFSAQQTYMSGTPVGTCVSDLKWALDNGPQLSLILLRAGAAGVILALLRRARDAGVSIRWPRNPLRLRRPHTAPPANGADSSSGTVQPRRAGRRHHFNICSVPYILGIYFLLALAQIGILAWRVLSAKSLEAPYPTCEPEHAGYWVSDFSGMSIRCYSPYAVREGALCGLVLALLVLPLTWVGGVLLHEDNVAMRWLMFYPGQSP